MFPLVLHLSTPTTYAIMYKRLSSKVISIPSLSRQTMCCTHKHNSLGLDLFSRS